MELTRYIRLLGRWWWLLALATVLADYLSRESIYTLVLKARGITIQGGRDVDILDSVLVEEVMARNIHTIVCSMSLVDLSELFSQTHSHGFIMLDNEGKLGGIVTITDLDRAIAQNMSRSTTAIDIGTAWEHLVTAYPDETIGEALGRMGVRGFGRLPVVSRADPRHVIGLVRRQDIVRAYNIALTRRAARVEPITRTKPDAIRTAAGSPRSVITTSVPVKASWRSFEKWERASSAVTYFSIGR